VKTRVQQQCMLLYCLHTGFAPAYGVLNSRNKQAVRSRHIAVAAASKTADFEHQLGRQEALQAAFGLLGSLAFAANAIAASDDLVKSQITAKVYLDVEIGGECCNYHIALQGSLRSLQTCYTNSCSSSHCVLLSHLLVRADEPAGRMVLGLYGKVRVTVMHLSL
jgi:hypothetical protein